MRKPFICGNWKMHTNRAEDVALAEATAAKAADVPAVDVGACPPACYLEAVLAAARGTPLVVGGQNMYFEEKGAFTGEIAGPMLADLGCTCVILGHSERRHVFGEGDDLISRKVHAALACGLVPILCVGELIDQRRAGETEAVVRRHVTAGVRGLSNEQAAGVVIAYEPVWAIGTGETATPDQAQEVHAFIRTLLADLYDARLAQAVRIQYGGSVKPENTRDLMQEPDIDGALVGGASLKADSFAGIIAEAAQAKGL
ncbi:MAG: triosephosphate isomerase [Planctomycetes bacterium DG_20]|nr:MAG: triosephosphate isomerase [Planctomycetes bacterium DG_20]